MSLFSRWGQVYADEMQQADKEKSFEKDETEDDLSWIYGYDAGEFLK
jgi:hypothetical protein